MNIHIRKKFSADFREKSMVNWDRYVQASRRNLLAWLISAIIFSATAVFMPDKEPVIIKGVFLGIGLWSFYFLGYVCVQFFRAKKKFFLELNELVEERSIANPIVEYIISDTKITVRESGEINEVAFSRYKYYQLYKDYIILTTMTNDPGVMINKNDLSPAELEELNIVINSRLKLKE